MNINSYLLIYHSDIFHSYHLYQVWQETGLSKNNEMNGLDLEVWAELKESRWNGEALRNKLQWKPLPFTSDPEGTKGRVEFTKAP